MTSTEEARLRSIATRATPLWDRAIQSGDHRITEPDLERARRRLKRWQQIFGSQAALKRRLLGEVFAPRALEGLLAGVPREATGALPVWALALASILSSSPSPSEVAQNEAINDRSFDSSRPLPFQEVLIGFVRYAREQLTLQAGSAVQILCLAAASALDRQLLAHLSFVASLTVGQDFYMFRFERAPASAMESVWSRLAPSTDIYREYVRHMYAGGLLDLLDRYPVLARLLAQSVEQWVATSTSFCQRFQGDFDQLRTFFGWEVGRPEGALDHLRTSLSDRHSGGQTVFECILLTGERVIYKPRGVRPEAAFSRFCSWLNGHGLSLDLRELRTLDRHTYGWAESVVHSPCVAPLEVERFYIRTGMLLGVLHILGATDIHRENLIAAGEHAVVVDLEMLFDDTLREPITARERDRVKQGDSKGEASILRTGLLPQWQAGDESHLDVSGLGAGAAQGERIDDMSWQAINTDQMILSRDEGSTAFPTHRVRLGERLPSVAEYLPAFIAGFSEMYELLLKNKYELASDEELLSCFDKLELRVLVRDTVTYTRIHLRLLHPELLKDGIDRSIELEWLARPLSGPKARTKPRLLIYNSERMAMENLDIPHFTASEWRSMEYSHVDELILLWEDRDDRVLRRRLASLCPSDYSEQLTAIRESVERRFGFEQPKASRQSVHARDPNPA